ncbi:hypothetical protein [Streptomyces sp. NPDC002122]|uniref:hypothetical protein n=1 Tax=Streptomyces sp. NPDC002122 TaxID=3154407 RepID=UPI003325551F
MAAGHYAIRRSDEEYLTLQNGDRTAGTPAVVFAPAGNPDQRWELKVLEAAAGTTTCTLRNLAGGSFLGYEEEPDADVLTGGFPEPVSWALSPGPDARRFTIAVPGADLHLGISLMRAGGHRSTRRRLAISPAVVCAAGGALTGQGAPRAQAETAVAAANVMEWKTPGYYASAWKIPQGITRITVRLWSPGGRGGGMGTGGADGIGGYRSGVNGEGGAAGKGGEGGKGGVPDFGETKNMFGYCTVDKDKETYTGTLGSPGKDGEKGNDGVTAQPEAPAGNGCIHVTW